MGWRDLLDSNRSLVFPWTGGRRLRKDEETWIIEQDLPQEHCWGEFLCMNNRKATFEEQTDPQPETLKYKTIGYLVGNRLVPDGVRIDPDPSKLASQTEEVMLLEIGIERFSRISAGRLFDDGPLIYKGLEFPLGLESEVMSAFLDEKSIKDLKGITPPLEAAFELENFQRSESRRRRAEIEKARKEAEERRAIEERRSLILKQLGDGALRRDLAQWDFEAAARAALAVGGAEYLDHRRSGNRPEMVVQFRFQRRKFECTCDSRTLRIIDSGICLTAHNDDQGFDEGTKGDNLFTLESLPSVIAEAIREHKLVVYRHVD